ncbi:MAG: hypothetical protein HYX34_11365 [Actinobacteria bacterium]|nr:hypothetical protein [Actinomycetota bacterium]
MNAAGRDAAAGRLAGEPAAPPLVDRWRPHRAGIRNIWEYDDQEFAFAGGRLILRGPNGSGKSNALALLFPFLIEGVMSAAKMDPFAGGRSMKSLLLGVLKEDGPDRRRFRHEQRTGYVWLELCRRRADGTDEHLTVGCGARATVPRDAHAWFFVTGRRPGFDLDLAPGGVPRTRASLATELGEDAVVDTAEAHRAAVDRALYGLGSERYLHLLELVRVLRRPQLAGKLDLERVSQVLSEGLPALAPDLIDDVAASFDNLEAVAADLARLADARRVVDTFVPTYRAYLRGVAASRVAGVIEGHRAERTAVRRRRDTHAELEALQRDEHDLVDAQQDLRVRIDEAEAQRRAIQESPAYRDAVALAELEGRAREAASHAAGAHARRQEADAAAARAAEAAARAAEEATAAGEVVQRCLTAVMDAADAAGVAWTLSPEDTAEPDRLRAALRSAVSARRHDVRAVRAALGRAATARAAHRSAEDALAGALGRLDSADTALAESRTERDEARSALRVAVVAWAGGLAFLDAAGAGMLAAAVDGLGSGGATLGETFTGLVRPRRDALVEDRTRLQRLVADLAGERAEVQGERDCVAAEADPGPAPPPWRSADRSARRGGPLWAMVDFAPALGEEARAAIEAALDAAGLLDAWIPVPADRPADPAAADRPAVLAAPADPADPPDPAAAVEAAGAPVPPGPAGDLDAWLLADAGAGAGATLADVLVPTPPDGCGLEPAAVTAVLRSIGLGRLGMPAGVDARGQFRLGPLTGRSAKPGAEFIGATAREARRQRRLAELDDRLAALDRSAAAAQADLAAVETDLGTLDGAVESLPSTDALDGAIELVRQRRADRRAAETRAGEARAAEGAAATRLAEAVDALGTEAAGRHLPTAPGELDDVDRRVDDVDHRAGQVVDALGARTRAVVDHERERDAAESAEATAAARRREWDDAARESAGLNARLETLRGQLGADAQEPLRALQRVEARGVELDGERRRLDDARVALGERLGGCRRDLQAAEEAVLAAGRQRAAAEERIPALRRAEILHVLTGPAPGEAETAARTVAADVPVEPLAFARWLEPSVGAPPRDEEATDHHRRLLAGFKSLLDDLHHSYEAALGDEDGVETVTVASDAGTFPITHLAVELAEQEAKLREYLSESDRELFERHLMTRVSEALRSLLNDADELVAEVNRVLAGARTASGLQVQLRWELEVDDAATRHAIGLLRTSPEMLADEDRDRVRSFFARAIETQRAEDPGAGYRAVLERALDHRSWHQFRPHLRTAAGGTTRLTRAKFRELSGGEQAVALHLPLFAAAAAHYARAQPTAPRLIALDEAFAGIDEAMRGELMGLLVRFDLDVIMTGHELWGAYAEVPAVAVYDLLRRPPAEGVSALGLRWDGHALADLHGA